MPAVTLNGTAFTDSVVANVVNYSSAHLMPQDIARDVKKPGIALEAPNGARTLIQRAVKSVWTLTWTQANDTTVGGVFAASILTGSFTAVIYGASLTVQCEDGCYKEGKSLVLPNGNRFRDVSLILYEV